MRANSNSRSAAEPIVWAYAYGPNADFLEF